MAAMRNPTELLIFGNPKKGKRARGRTKNAMAGHKRGCKCFACKYARGEKVNPSTAAAKRATRERAGKIRAARLNPKKSAKGGKSAERRRAGRPSLSRRRRLNPNETEQAVQLFETFHGRDASKILEKQVSTMIRKDYTALGDLMYITVKTPIGQKVTFNFQDDHVKLACSPNGKQLYCIGGSQNLLPLLDADSQQKDFIDLGEAIEVAYFARKIHNNFEPTEWYHKFGEARDGSTKPQLMFDKLKKQIFFIGGEYWIDANVDLSPGIEN